MELSEVLGKIGFNPEHQSGLPDRGAWIVAEESGREILFQVASTDPDSCFGEEFYLAILGQAIENELAIARTYVDRCEEFGVTAKVIPPPWPPR